MGLGFSTTNPSSSSSALGEFDGFSVQRLVQPVAPFAPEGQSGHACGGDRGAFCAGGLRRLLRGRSRIFPISVDRRGHAGRGLGEGLLRRRRRLRAGVEHGLSVGVGWLILGRLILRRLILGGRRALPFLLARLFLEVLRHHASLDDVDVQQQTNPLGHGILDVQTVVAVRKTLVGVGVGEDGDRVRRAPLAAGRPVLPPAPIDDELAKRYGADDLDALKGQIEERLKAEYSGAARQVMKRQLLDALDDAVAFELPPSLVEAEAGQIAHQLWHEDNPDHEGHDHPEIETTDEHTKLAERRVRLGLFLAEIGNKNEIEVSDAEMTQAVMAQARQYPGQERAVLRIRAAEPQMRQQIRAPIFEDKVVDYIFELAEVKEKTVKKAALEKGGRGARRRLTARIPRNQSGHHRRQSARDALFVSTCA